jgi:hypothetical protein
MLDIVDSSLRTEDAGGRFSCDPGALLNRLSAIRGQFFRIFQWDCEIFLRDWHIFIKPRPVSNLPEEKGLGARAPYTLCIQQVYFLRNTYSPGSTYGKIKKS